MKTQVKIEIDTYLPGIGVQSEIRHIVVSVLRDWENIVDPENPLPVGTSSIWKFSLTSRADS